MPKRILKTRVSLLLTTYCIYTLLYIIQKPIFLLFQSEQSSSLGWKMWLDIICSGFSMDLSMAGYMTIFPALLLLISVYYTKHLKVAINIYFIISCILNTLIFVPDVVLYSFWGFRIDSTIFTYLTSPAGAAASLPIWQIMVLFLIAIAYFFAQYIVFRKCIVNRFPKEKSKRKLKVTSVMIVLLGIMFIAIRGGVTTSTMNVSRVYFSDNMFVNHAATNPTFNMFKSMKGSPDFSKEYRFMENSEADKVFADLMNYDRNIESKQVLTNKRPNIVLIVLESFGPQIMESLGGAKGIAPNMNRLAEEGVFFRNIYASSFRTDRGIVATLAGFPAQPTTSILKYPNKVTHLQTIHRSLINEGYKASFMYGGDVNFAEIKNLFVTQKVTDITTDTDFALEDRMTKWGVPDAITFSKLSKDIENEKREPYLKMFLTLSSHEPFDVPTNKFEDPYFNSVAYTDSCIGIFIDKLKASPQWANTLVIFIPDHNMKSGTMNYNESARHGSFMLWTGGAVKEALKVDKLGSQTDFAATLLNQLGVKTEPFIFSKDILNPSSHEFAFYSFPNGFGAIGKDSKVVYDESVKKVLTQEGANSDSLLLQGKAFLQYLYNDISKK